MPINKPISPLVTQIPELYYIQLVLAEVWILAAVCSAFGSGFLILLYGKCMTLVVDKQNQRSARMRYFLAAYMTVMMSLSLCQTIMVGVLSIGGVRYLVAEVGKRYFPPEKAECSFCNAVEIVAQVCMTIANWGMDGFMIWRCTVLYRDSNRLRRLALHIFAFIIGGASLASGISFLAAWFPPSLKWANIAGPWRPVSAPLSFFACVTLFIYITFTSLISIRLWRHQSRLQKSFGPGYGSIYRRIIVILLESAALVVVANIAMIVLLFLFIPGATPISCSVIHIYVASPLIILYRIHSKKDMATEISNFNVTRQLELNETKRPWREPLQFMTPESAETVVSFAGRASHDEHVPSYSEADMNKSNSSGQKADH